MTRRGLLAVAILSGSLSACGGGGGGGGGSGGDTGIAYQGKSTQAELDSKSSPALAGELLDRMSVAADGFKTSKADSSTPRLLLNSHDILNATFRLKKRVRGTARAAVDETVQCESGTVRISGNFDENALRGTLTYDYNACLLEGATFSGRAIMRIDGYDPGWNAFTDVTYTYSNLVASWSGGSVTQSGTTRSVMSPDGYSGTDLHNKVARWSDGAFVRLENYQVIWSADYGYSVALSGRVYLSPYGYVDVLEGSSLAFTSASASYPTSGSLLLAGANGSRLTVTPRYSGVELALDSDGDGVYEGSASFGWDDLAPDNGNHGPQANAGGDRAAVVGTTVALDGSASGDWDGDTLSYAWSFDFRPTDSNATITSSSSASAAFVPDVAGMYVVTLTVSDGSRTDTATITITATEHVNAAPVAEAGTNQQVGTGSVVNLDAGNSSDADGDSLSYAWSFNSRPTGSGAAINSSSSVSASFVPDVAGTYVVALTVSDGSLTDTATITVTATEPPNAAPVAMAGPDQRVSHGTLVTLDAGNSSDSDGDSLSYSWTLLSAPNGSSATLSTSNNVMTSITPDRAGTYAVALTVNDGKLSSTDEVLVIVPVSGSLDSRSFSLTLLDVAVTDAEYSAALDAVVYVSADTNRLYIHPIDGATPRSVALSVPPKSVSVAPNGLSAVVGHNAWISVVDLEAATVRTVAISADIGDIVLGGNGYTYTFAPAGAQWSQVYATNLTTGTSTPNTGMGPYGGSKARLHPSGDYIYSADNGLSPSDIEKYDIRAGTAAYMYDSPYHGDYAMCGNLWFSRDGDRIFTACGNVFRSAADQAADMIYNGSLGRRVTALAHSSTRSEVAVFTSDTSYYGNPLADSVIHVHEDQYLGYLGELSLPPATVNGATHVLHGRHLFYDAAGVRLVTVAQVDQTSLGATRYALAIEHAPDEGDGGDAAPTARILAPLAAHVDSSVLLDGASSLDPEETTLSYSWEMVSKPVGSVSTLTSADAPQSGFTPDVTGLYRLRLTVHDGVQASTPAEVEVNAIAAGSDFVQHLDLKVVDAEYSDALDAIVLVGSSPHRLYILRTADYHLTSVDLPVAPKAVSVSPDGLAAVVGHDAYLSHVNLQTGSRVATYEVASVTGDIAFGDGYAYVFPASDQWSAIHSVNLTTGTASQSGDWLIYAGTQARFHPDGNRLYGVTRGLSPGSMERYPISGGTATSAVRWPYHGDYSPCGNLWISAGGGKIYTGCGRAFWSSDSATDMTYAGALSSTSTISSYAGFDDLTSGRGIALPTSQAAVIGFDTHYLNETDRIELPPIEQSGSSFPAQGKHVFYNSTGSRFFVLLHAADSDLFGVAFMSGL